MDIALIGGRTSTSAFGALGVRTFVVDRPEDAVSAWERIPFEELGLLLVNETVYGSLPEQIAELRERTLPVVLVIPTLSGSRGIGRKELRELVEKATGTSMVMERGPW